MVFSYDIVFGIKTTSLIRPLLSIPNGGLNIGILLYMKLNTLIEGCKGNCRMQELLPYLPVFMESLTFLILQYSVCLQHMSEIVEGNKVELDTLSSRTLIKLIH